MAAFPPDVRDITLQWLQSVFRHYGNVSDFRIEPIKEHTGSISLLTRVWLEYDEQTPLSRDAPRSVVAKTPGTRQSSWGFQERETRFFQSPLVDPSVVPLPHCFFAQVDPDTKTGMLLLQDFKDYHVGSWAHGFSRPRLINAMQTYARMHANRWGKEQVADRKQEEDYEAQRVWLDEQLGYIADVTGASFARLLSHKSREVFEMAERSKFGEQLFRNGPITLIHGDAQLGNLFFNDRDEVVAMIDWQSYMPGSCIYDLSYFFCLTLPTEIRRELESECLVAYVDELLRNGVTDYTLDRLHAEYPLGIFFIGLNGLFRLTGYMRQGDEGQAAWGREVVSRVEAAYADWNVWEVMKSR